MFWGLLSDVNKHMRHIVQCRQLFVCATCLSLFCLQEMQQGVNDVFPGSVFDSLTPEDLHLLMNRSPVVDVEVLKKIMSFMDKSRECHMTPGECHLAGVAHASPFRVSPVCELPVCFVTLHILPVPLMPPFHPFLYRPTS